MTCRGMVIAALLLPSLTAVGCAKAAGGKAAEGALEEVQKTAEERRQAGEKPALEIAAGNAARGTLEAFDDSVTQEQLRRAVGIATESALTTALDSLQHRGAWGGGPPARYGTPIGSFGGDLSAGFALGISRQLQLELGPDGSGPLGKTLTGLAQEMSGAVANGVVAELSPVAGDCTEPDRKKCVDRRVYEASRLAAVGFADGIAHSLRIPVLVLTFLGGFVVALIIATALRRRTA